MKNGEIISLEQLYKMLHISKRKAAWMLQNGIIPCEIRNTPTHKYSVRKEDVLAYMAKSDREKRKEIPVGIFNAKRQTTLAEPSRLARTVGVILMIRIISSVARSVQDSRKCSRIFFLPYPTRSPWTRSPS